MRRGRVLRLDAGCATPEGTVLEHGPGRRRAASVESATPGSRLRRPGGRRAPGARGLELAAGAVEARVDAVARTEHADDEQHDQEDDGGHALTMPSRDYQHKS